MSNKPTITTFYGDGREPETREMTDEEIAGLPDELLSGVDLQAE